MIKQVKLKRHNRTEKQIINDINRYCKSNDISYTNLVVTDTEVSFTTYSKITYDNLVNQLVKERYSDSEEFAILRKAMTEKTDEFYIYNAYVEDCKVRAKAFIQERDKVLGA